MHFINMGNNLAKSMTYKGTHLWTYILST